MFVYNRQKIVDGRSRPYAKLVIIDLGSLPRIAVNCSLWFVTKHHRNNNLLQLFSVRRSPKHFDLLFSAILLIVVFQMAKQDVIYFRALLKYGGSTIGVHRCFAILLDDN